MTTDPSIEVRRARAQLASALTALEDKANLPRRAKNSVNAFRQEHPVAFVTAGVAAVAAVGAAVWFGVSMFRARR